MAAELRLDMRPDGYVRVSDLLKLNLQTFAKIPLKSHTVDEIREAVRRDNRQRFSLLEDDGELLIWANQGHSYCLSKIGTVEATALLHRPPFSIVETAAAALPSAFSSTKCSPGYVRYVAQLQPMWYLWVIQSSVTSGVKQTTFSCCASTTS